MRPDDWPTVSAIYQEGIETGQATFQTDVPAWEDWDRAHLRTCRLVAVSGENILAWAAVSPVSPRPVYSGVVEVSVYVSAANRGQGIGRKILSALVNEAEAEGDGPSRPESFLKTKQACRFIFRAASESSDFDGGSGV